MDYLFHTIKYYEEWIGQKGVLTEVDSHGKTDIIFMQSEQCKITLEGYSNVFDIYLFNMDNILIISYGNKAKSLINSIKSSICPETKFSDIIEIIETKYCIKALIQLSMYILRARTLPVMQDCLKKTIMIYI